MTGAEADRARLAGEGGIRGLDKAVTLAEARAFFASLGPGRRMIVKALVGGGGRGTRAVRSSGISNMSWIVVCLPPTRPPAYRDGTW